MLLGLLYAIVYVNRLPAIVCVTGEVLAMATLVLVIS